MPLKKKRNVFEHLLLAEELTIANRLKDVINTYKLILASEPKNLTALLGISDTLLKLNQNSEAKRYVRKAYEIYSGSDDMVAVNYSCVLMDNMQYAKAIAILEKEREKKSQNYLVYNNLGYGYFLLSDFDNAFVNYNTSIELNNDNPLAYCNRGVLRYFIYNDDNGIEDLEKANKYGDLEAEMILRLIGRQGST